jgi:hypothetical protein
MFVGMHVHVCAYPSAIVCVYIYIHTHIYIYRVSQEEWTKLRESVPYFKIYRYNPKHLYQKLNGYGDNGQRKVWSSLGFHALYLPADRLMHAHPSVRYHITAYAISKLHTFRLIR